jgi:amino acid adenylation domain-containing protein/non-ribosomal peptide synthase protein (TIGR01720 family)
MDIQQLIKYVLQQVQKGQFDKEVAFQLLKTLSNETQKQDDIAIIGMGCRLPKANNPQEFWEVLKNGINCVSKIPESRKEDFKHIVGDADNKYFDGAYLDQINLFDPAYFKIPPKVAKEMDPYQRLFMQVLVESIEDAGYSKESLYGSLTGVFVGTDHTHKLIGSYLGLTETPDFSAMTGSWTGVLASRASYFLNLMGPSMVSDSACSSGLSALYQAINSIYAGDCTQALVGGINLFVVPIKIGGEFTILDDVESKDLTVKTFDKKADGTVWGEAVCSFMIKPLKKAIEDGDNIYSVIKGIASNNDGASNGLSAPNPKAQEEVILRAWKKAKINPENLSYIEAHGTGTVLGDPIEIKGLNGAFKQYTDKKQFCGIGSVKTNIGHTVGAAGLVSLMKIALSLKNQQLAPSINFTEPNPYIDFTNSPLYVHDHLQAWEQPSEKPRLAAINSFSINGTNFHVVLEDAPQKHAVETSNQYCLFTISSRNPLLFAQTVQNCLDDVTINTASLSNICYTNNTGRTHYNDFRVAIVTNSKEDLRDKLYQIQEGNYLNLDGIFISSKLSNIALSPSGNNVEALLVSEHSFETLSSLAEAYTKNVSVNWNTFYKNQSNKRVSLPPHPFDNQKYWLDSYKNLSTNPSTTQKKSVKSITIENGSDVSEEEYLVAQIIGNVLGFDSVNLEDDFYNIGGDSVSAMQIMNVLNAELKQNMGVSILLKNSVLGDFAKSVSEHIKVNSSQNSEKSSVIRIAPDALFYPLSSAQKRMYLLWQMNTESVQYNVSTSFKIPSEYTEESIIKAFQKIIQKYAILRTNFSINEGTIVQQIHESSAFKIESKTYESRLGDENLWIKNQTQVFIKPFDLASESLLRVCLLKFQTYSQIVIDVHHIVIDGGSMGIIINDLRSLLNNGHFEAQTRLQYKDFVVWQQAQLSNPALKNQEKFWLECFADEISGLNLVTDFQRPKLRTFSGKTMVLSIENELCEPLKIFAKNNNTTLYTVLLSGLNIALSKYSNQKDITIGSPVAGRSHQDLHTMVGVFINTLAIRSEVDGNSTYSDYLKQLKNTILNAFDNQDYQFEDLVEKLNIKRESNRNPIFDVLFELQNEEIGLSDTQVELFEIENNISKFDFSISARENLEGIRCQIEYSTELFREETIAQLFAHYKNILQQIIIHSEQKINTLQLVIDKEELLVLSNFNQAKTSYPEEATVNQLFEIQAFKTPKKPALVCKNEVLTYQDLNEKSNQLARTLRKMGVSIDTCVGIIAERSPELIIGILGILKAGGAYVPIDANYPQARKAFMIQDCGIEIILTTTLLSKQIDVEASILCLDEESIYHENKATLSSKNAYCDLAYIMYTSGSTGEAKGVMIEHRNVVRLVKNINYVPLNADTNILLTGAVVFDATTFEYWGSLLNGGTLHIIDEDTLLNPVAFKQEIINSKINTLWLTTGLFNQLVDDDVSIFETITYLLMGGERISVSHVNQFRENCRNTTLIHCYGPTENTTFSTTFTITDSSQNIPIGKPISNSSIFILDEGLNMLPVGAIGEIYTGGDGIARGYLNQVKLTTEKFIQSPFDSVQKLYKSGDLAYWQADGNIQFIGRTDFQVKIRGFRIELGEIERILNTHPSIKESFVVADKEESGSKYIIAYFVNHNGLTVKEIRKYLSDLLPDYMIPSYLVSMDKLPLNANGKVDKRALPAPTIQKNENEYVAPINPTQQALVEIWQGLLLESETETKISITDNFFELGGQSLKAMSLSSKINEIFGVSISLSVIFENSTIQELSSIIDKSEAKTQTIDLIEAIPLAQSYTLSSAQRRMFALQNLDRKTTAYNMPAVYFIKESIDSELFENSFAQLIERHESMRTSFEFRNGEAVQIIHNTTEWKCDFEHAERLKNLDLDELIKGFVQPFDLSKPNLIRVKLISLKDDAHFKHIFMFDTHHIISDGSSIDLLIRELAQISAKQTLPKLNFQYKDFAEWQKQLLQSPYIESQKNFWLEQFKGEIPILELTTDFARPAYQTFKGNHIGFEMEDNLAIRIKKYCQQEGLTLQIFLLSAYYILLSKYTNQEDIVVGLPIAGRNHVGLEKLIGMFVNSLAMRNKPKSEKSISDFLKEVRQNSLQSYDNQDFTYDLLVDSLNLERNTSRNPLFDTVFVFQENIGEINAKIQSLGFEAYQFQKGTCKFDLLLEVYENIGGLQFDIEYATDLFSVDTINRFAKHYQIVLEQLVNQPATTQLSAIELLSEKDKMLILNTFNDTKSVYAFDKTIIALFEEQVILNPDKIALVYENTTFTYQKLDEKAQKIAFELSKKGVSAGKSIAFCMPRNADMIVAILAILKVGAAYVPIDASYPTERVNFLLNDCQAPVIITTSELTPIFEVLDIEVLDIAGQFTENQLFESNLVTAQSPAYIIYTSGSTGNPKGVVVSNQNVVRLVKNTNYVFLDTDTRILQTGASVFDATTFEYWGSLLNGGTLVMIPESTLLDVKKMNDEIVKNHISTLWLTVGLFNQLAEQNPKMFESLKYLLVGGDKLSPNPINKVREICPNLQIINGYGPTENTTFSVCHVIDRTYKNRIPIGKPISNSSAYIVNSSGKLLPVGVVGELWVGGDGVALGYLNAEDLTNQKFINNPFGEGRIYKTGDLAKWLPDGTIDFIGRKDFQVKIRGYRIEIGEIEHAILAYGGVKEAIIVVKKDTQNQSYLCGYFTSENKYSNLEIPLRTYLSEYLPDYMLPRYLMELDHFPLTINGKIDRKILPEQTLQLDNFETPRNPMENILSEIWQDVLGIETIGINDNYFMLGGDSIKAIQISAKLQMRHLSMEVGKLFQYPTIAELSPFVSTEVKYVAEQGQVIGEVLLTPIQQWFFEQNFVESHFFNQGIVINSKDRLDENIAIKALHEVINHHDALRMKFENIDNHYQQYNRSSDSETLKFEVHDFHNCENIDEKIKQKSREIQQTVELEKGALVTASLFRTAINDQFFITAHHLVVDSVSWQIIMEDFLTSYTQLSENKNVALPEKTTSYKAWADSLREYAGLSSIQNEQKYWISFQEKVTKLLDNQPDETKYPRSTSQSIIVEFDKTQTELFAKNIHHAYNTDANDILLTALTMAFNGWINQENILINLEGHGREELFPEININRTVGWFTALYPVMLSKIPGDISQQIKNTKETLRKVHKKGLGFGILKYFGDDNTRTLLRSIKPEICFNYMGEINNNLDDQSLTVSPMSAMQSISQDLSRIYTLDINGFVINGLLTIDFSFSEKLFTFEQITPLTHSFKTYMTAIIEHCSSQENTEMTASDFTSVDLDEDELNAIFSDLDID